MKSISLSDAVSIVSLSVAGIACVSLAYEYGFSRGIDLSLAELSLSAEDLARSAVNWAPLLFIGALGIFALEATTSAIEGGKTEDEILQTSPFPNFMRCFRSSPDYLFLALALFLFGALIFDARFIRPFAHLCYALVWLGIVGFLVTRHSLRRKFPPKLLFAFWAIGGLMLFVYGRGKSDALHASGRAPVDVIELSSGRSLSGILIRQYSQFALFYPADRSSLIIVPASEIRSIKRANKAPEPTPSPVTPRAGARVAPAAGVAHL